MAALLCTVRDCLQPLRRETRRLVCPNGHSFDLARSGYINLLQPQERRSKEPGDSHDAAAARRRVHDRGVTAPMLRVIEEMLAPSPGDAILDAGCGTGDVIGVLGRKHGFEAHGIDISTAAIELAAKRYPDCTWIVGNADRFLPYAGASFNKLMTITARMNASEFRRVLRDDARLLVGVSAPDDLVELRGEGHDRAARVTDELADSFPLIEQRRVTTVIDADEDLLRDLRLSIYRPRGATNVAHATLSLDLLLFARG
jgi:23S rRNA (guanine745-N1)-methyltransferase